MKLPQKSHHGSPIKLLVFKKSRKQKIQYIKYKVELQLNISYQNDLNIYKKLENFQIFFNQKFNIINEIKKYTHTKRYFIK